MGEIEELERNARKVGLMLDLYISNEVFVVDHETTYKMKQAVVEASKLYPEEVFLLIYLDGYHYLLRGKLMDLYIKKNPGKMYVFFKDGMEYWRREHQLKV